MEYVTSFSVPLILLCLSDYQVFGIAADITLAEIDFN